MQGKLVFLLLELVFDTFLLTMLGLSYAFFPAPYEVFQYVRLGLIIIGVVIVGIRIYRFVKEVRRVRAYFKKLEEDQIASDGHTTTHFADHGV